MNQIAADYQLTVRFSISQRDGQNAYSVYCICLRTPWLHHWTVRVRSPGRKKLLAGECQCGPAIIRNHQDGSSRSPFADIPTYSKICGPNPFWLVPTFFWDTAATSLRYGVTDIWWLRIWAVCGCSMVVLFQVFASQLALGK